MRRWCVALALVVIAVLPQISWAQVVLSWTTGYPKTGPKNQVLVQGKSDLTKVPYKSMKFVTVYAGLNGGQKSMGVEIAISSTTGQWGAADGTAISGPAGTYNPGDTLQIWVIGKDGTGKEYELTGSAASGRGCGCEPVALAYPAFCQARSLATAFSANERPKFAFFP